MKSRAKKCLDMEAKNDLLDEWFFVLSLRFSEPQEQQRRILAHLATAGVLPLPDCSCAVCQATRAAASNA